MRTSIILCQVPLLVVAASGCGFHPAPVVSNVCNLLTLDEARTLEPTLVSFEEEPPEDTADQWYRGCRFSGSPSFFSVRLGIWGALTPRGEQSIDADLSRVDGYPEISATSVSGVGDRAVYFESHYGEFVELAAKRGSDEVGLVVQPRQASASELAPLVRKVLSELP